MISVRRVPAFWRDTRFWTIAGQVLFLLAVAALLYLVYENLQANLRRIGLALGFGFLRQPAAFDIGEGIIPYRPADTYFRAYLVGLTNTLRVAGAGIVLATVLGCSVGIARLSSNWLIRQFAAVYVELLRNTPLLLQLFFWYFAVLIRLPRIEDAVVWPGPVYLSNRGLAVPWLARGPSFDAWIVAFLVALVAGAAVYRWRLSVRLETGGGGSPALAGLGAFASIAGLSWLLAPGAPIVVDAPYVEGVALRGGLRLSPEFSGLLIGLVVYTSAFIGEVVRAGIQSVPRGQVEAARAVGLRPALVLRLVVFPQALRVIVPPLTSQYLNLTKNSSLAVAIGYPDAFFVGQTTFNQTGRSVEVVTLIMATYLTISLLTSLLMNLYNRFVQLVER